MYTTGAHGQPFNYINCKPKVPKPGPIIKRLRVKAFKDVKLQIV